MCITEYGEARVFAELRAEGYELGKAEGYAEGFAKGMEEGKLSLLTYLVEDGILSVPEAAKRADMSTPDFEAKTGLKA